MFKKNFQINFVLFLGMVFFFGLINGISQNQESITKVKRDVNESILNRPQVLDANLDQCANGSSSLSPVVCSGKAWQNGSLNQTQAHYYEGESVPYRVTFTGLAVGSTNTVTIEYDTTENSGAKHAIDAVTSFNASELSADPCSGIAGCDPLVKNIYAIPDDPKCLAGLDGVLGTSDDIPPMGGDFTIYNGVITDVSAYTMTGSYAGASQTSITITFVANAANPVLAWGGHISTRMHWGVGNSAIAISGSPFHMRLLEFNGAAGNQDRSLSSAATIFPGQLSIIKDARPNTTDVFGFTGSGPSISNFTLVDDGTNAANTQAFNNLINFGTANTITITENTPSGFYSLSDINCVENPMGGTGLQNSTVDLPTKTANIILEEGEFVTCTFVNSMPSAASAIISGRVTTADGGYVTDAYVTAIRTSTGEMRTARTNTFGFYQFENLSVGETYVLRIQSRRYEFVINSNVIMLMADFADANFMALPR